MGGIGSRPGRKRLQDELRGRLSAGDVDGASRLAVEALEGVGWPRQDTVLLPEELSPEQRRVALELAAITPLYIGEFAIPISARVRERWLGLSEPGPLERKMEFEVEGEMRTWPLWRYLAEEEVDEDERLELVRGLPHQERLELIAELILESYEIDLDYSGLLRASVDEEDGEAADWAAAFADELLALMSSGPSIEANQFRFVVDDLKDLVFYPWARAGRRIEERWKVFIPVTRNRRRMQEVAAALPEEQREELLLERLDDSLALAGIEGSLAVLDVYTLPSIADQLRGWLLDPEVERAVGRERIRPLRKRFRELVAALPELA